MYPVASRSAKTLLISLALVLMVAVACESDSTDPEPSGGTSSEGTATDPTIEQARWKTKVLIAPGHKRLSKKQKDRIRKKGKDVEAIVRDLYEALILSPDRSKKAISARFIPSAAKAFLGKKAPGVPKDAVDVRTLRRTASIAIEAATTRLASAEVFVKARGLDPDKSFVVAHRATLWFEKSSGRWKVVAFEVDQEPVR